MSRIRKFTFTDDAQPPPDQAELDRQTASLGGLALTLLLIVVGLFLIKHLHREAMIEDCLLSGRTNCLVVAAIP